MPVIVRLARLARFALLASLVLLLGRDVCPAGTLSAPPDSSTRVQAFRRARAAWEAGQLDEARRFYEVAARLPEDVPAEQRAALARVNHHRREAMLMPVMPHPAVAAAARAHAAYLRRHGGDGPLSLEGAHRERPGRRGFTGVTLRDRIARQGLDVRGCAEVVSACTDPVEAVDHLMNTVYHRAGLLREEARYAGFGVSSRAVIDLAWSGDETVEASYSLYPGPGQEGASPRFPGGETPEPLPGVSYPVGPPISIGGAREAPTLIAARLEGPEGSVPLRILRQGTAPHAEMLGAFVFLVPTRPLQENGVYRADVSFAVEGRRHRRRWSFATGERVPGEERWWARVTRLARTEGRLVAGGRVVMEAEVEASHPDELILEWLVDGRPVERGRERRFVWQLPDGGTRRLEILASYPRTPGAHARRGIEVDLGTASPAGTSELREGTPAGGGLRFHPAPPWNRGDVVRIDADPLEGRGSVSYDFLVDGRPIPSAGGRRAWWTADGAPAHRFQLRCRFEGGTATRTVEIRSEPVR